MSGLQRHESSLRMINEVCTNEVRIELEIIYLVYIWAARVARLNIKILRQRVCV